MSIELQQNWPPNALSYWAVVVQLFTQDDQSDPQRQSESITKNHAGLTRKVFTWKGTVTGKGQSIG